jgi:hypothetical protein
MLFTHHGHNSPSHWDPPGFDSCTTPIQQLYNNPSHEGGSHILGLLYSCCIGVVNLTFSGTHLHVRGCCAPVVFLMCQ